MKTNSIILYFKKKNDKILSPFKKYKNDAGWDIYSDEKEYILKPNSIVLIHTGLFLNIPSGYYGMLCSRSGLTLEQKIFLLNSPGIIDENYTGELCGILANFSSINTKIIKPYTRFCQLLIIKQHNISFKQKNNINKNSKRKNKGFGSTGYK